MYTDMVVDGCLKGLGPAGLSMAINIFLTPPRRAARVVFSSPSAPSRPISAIYFNETLNFVLSLACAAPHKYAPSANKCPGRGLYVCRSDYSWPGEGAQRTRVARTKRKTSVMPRCFLPARGAWSA